MKFSIKDLFSKCNQIRRKLKKSLRMKAFDHFKNKQHKCFLICESVNILKVYSTNYTLRKNTNVKKLSFGQNKRYKNCPFFLSRAPTQYSFTFNSRFLYELKHKVRISITVCGIFHFRFRFVFIKVYIFVQPRMLKKHGLFDSDNLIIWLFENLFQNKNNRKAIHSFAPRPLIFKLQQEVLKLNHICVSWSSP